MRTPMAMLALAAGVVFALGTGAAAAQDRPAATSPDTEVIVFAAASLTSALQAAGARFEKEHPNFRVQFNFGGSPTLVQQIMQGAPADIFASADEPNMQKLIDGEEVAGQAQVFARNSLEIIVPTGNPKQ